MLVLCARATGPFMYFISCLLTQVAASLVSSDQTQSPLPFFPRSKHDCISQAGLELATELNLSSCLHLSSVVIISMYHHAWFMLCWRQN